VVDVGLIADALDGALEVRDVLGEQVQQCIGRPDTVAAPTTSGTRPGLRRSSCGDTVPLQQTST